jgi:outer membrane protein insertion porin family
MIKKHLTPRLMAMVAMTIPLAISVKANAQTTDNQAQTTEVLTSETNQPEKQNLVKSAVNENPAPYTLVVPTVTEKEPNQFSPLVKVLTPNITAQAPETETGREKPKPPTVEPKPVNQQPVIIPKPTIVPQKTPVTPTQPTQAPEAETPTATPTPSPNPEPTETRVLVSEVMIKSETEPVTPELETEVYKVIRTQAGQTSTRSQIQEDINAIFRTGFFSNVQAFPEDTPLGVRVSFIVTPNPILSKVELEVNPGTGVASVLPVTTANEIFSSQYGKILNLRELNEGIKQLTKLYQDQGYVLANLIGAPKVSETGVVTLQVAEGVVESVKVRFRNKDGEDVDDKGNPIRGRTKDYIIIRELELKPGTIFNRNTVQRDLARVYGLALVVTPAK